VLWIRTHFFGVGFGSTNYFFRIRIRIRILTLIFWPQIFLNGASNCFHICSETCTSEKKKNFNRKTLDFSLSSVWFLIFHKNFHPTTVSESESVSESELFFSDSDSDPAKTFGFGSTTLLGTRDHLIPGLQPHAMIFIRLIVAWYGAGAVHLRALLPSRNLSQAGVSLPVPENHFDVFQSSVSEPECLSRMRIR
jgi:hypothetical protein